MSVKDHAEVERLVRIELKAHFRPEFLNRVDDIIIFHSLNEEQLSKIVDVQLRGLEKRLSQQNLHLEIDLAAKKVLAKEGYDPQFGARPLKRTIQELLLDPLAMKLLAGEFKPGDNIQLKAQAGELTFQKK
jgi:ATP-dependent Clp protease ATP-binding subunit ClpB